MVPGAAKFALIVEDDEELAKMLEEMLTAQQYRTQIVAKAQDAIAKLQNQLYAVILLDIHLSHGSSGEDVITAVRGDRKEINNLTPIIVISGGLDVELVKRIGPLVSGVLVKPFTKETLLSRLAQAAPPKTD